MFLFLFVVMIKLQNITKSFKDKKALENLSLSVNSGEIFFKLDMENLITLKKLYRFSGSR